MSSHDVEYVSPPHDAFERINEAWRARAETLAEWTFTALVNRVDVWGAYLPVKRREKRGVAFTRPYPSERGTLVLKPSMLVRHYLGSDPQSTIGLHAVSAKNDGRWLVVDIDQKDPNASEALKNDRFRLALRLVQELRHCD